MNVYERAFPLGDTFALTCQTRGYYSGLSIQHSVPRYLRTLRYCFILNRKRQNHFEDSHHCHFLVTPGADLNRNALSNSCNQRTSKGMRLVSSIELDLPLFRTLYTNSTTTSISFTAAALKFFRTASASCSLLTRLFSFLRAIVGLCLPMPGFVKRAWLRGEVKAAGEGRLCATR